MYLCGPAAVVFVLFLKYPARSVQICQSLFEKGEIGPPLTSSKTIRAAEALRERDLPPGMSQVDWMLIATLREAENLFFTVDPQASKLAQMAGQVTTAFAMESWAREVLFYTHVESISCNFFGETDAMRKAEAAVAQGGCAFLNINATPLDQLIHGTPPDTPIQGFGNISTPINMADHWIAVAERIEMKDGKIRFPCFTWGKRVVIEADQTTFNRCLFYVVTAY
jgi:hypothetical protein